jgi:hypothetical protein
MTTTTEPSVSKEFAYIEHVGQSAGLSPSELLHLLPISRGTYYGWKRGGPIRDKLRLTLSVARAKVIEAAVANGELPLPDYVPRRERLTVIKKILTKTKGGQ